MANEITAKASITFTKSKATVTMDIGTLQIDVTGSQFIHNVQSVGTSEEAILLGDAGAGGMCFMINRDATNFVSIRQGTGASDLIRLDPLEFAFFRLDDDATAPYWIADTAACEVEYVLIED